MDVELSDPIAAALSRRDFLALIGLATSVGLSGCSLFASKEPAEVKAEAFANLRRSLEEVSDDPEQADRLLGLANSLEVELEELETHAKTSWREIGELSVDFDAQRSDLTEAVARQSRRRTELIVRVLKTEELLKKELDEGQWSRVSQALTQGYDATARSVPRH